MIGLKRGTLNVGTLSKRGRLEEVIDIMKERKIDIIGLSETMFGTRKEETKRGIQGSWVW
jgi:hypothetical protein